MAAENTDNPQRLALMSTMAQPKPIETKRQLLTEVSKRAPITCLLLCMAAIGLAFPAVYFAQILPTLPALFGSILLAIATLILGRMIPLGLNEESPQLARNITIYAFSHGCLCALIALNYGIAAAYGLQGLPPSWGAGFALATCGAASLLAFIFGVSLLPSLLLLSTPALWLFTSWGFSTYLQSEIIIFVTVFTAFIYPLNTLWQLSNSRLRQQQTHNTKLIRFLNNALDDFEKTQTQLEKNLAERDKTKQNLLKSQNELEYKFQQRESALTDANAALSKQIKLRKSVGDALVKSQTRLAQAIEASRLALWDLDLPGNAVYQSFFHPVFGPRETTARKFLRHMRSIVNEDDYKRATIKLHNCLRGITDRYRLQYRIELENHSWMWVEDCGKVVETGATGKAVRMLGTRRDITADKRRDEQLRLTKSVFDNSSEGVFALDAGLRFMTVNKAFQRITGFLAADIIGKKLQEFSQVPNKEKVFELILAQLLTNGSWQGELYEKRKGGDYFSEYLQLKAITNAEGKVTHYAGLFSDLTERKEKDEKLHSLLNYDELTGLANRVLFRDRLHRHLQNLRHGINRTRQKTQQDRSIVASQHETTFGRIALLIIDLDRFNRVNESLGHDLGDNLLKQVAERLTRCSHNVDTVARLGNDEFAIILTDNNRIELAKFCETLLTSLKVPYVINNQEFFVSTSIGITQAPEQGREVQPLLQQANTALKQAKYLGGNTYEFYSLMLQDVSSKRLQVETDLRRAIQYDELFVYYQPKLRLATQQLTGAEALARWRHPQRGMIAPANFVQVAEESGLISSLGERILLQACQQAQAWSSLGLGKIHVAVNVSAYQMRQNKLPQLVKKVLEESGLTPELLDLELTESALMEDLNLTRTTLYRLRDMGIKITIDDFGTGYSSLSYLKRFPINALKIDRMFIKDVHCNSDDAAITRAIILLANSLNLEVIAEGVETPQHLEFLINNGCHYAQGYLINKPMDAKDMTGRFHEQLQQPITIAGLQKQVDSK